MEITKIMPPFRWPFQKREEPTPSPQKESAPAKLWEKPEEDKQQTAEQEKRTVMPLTYNPLEPELYAGREKEKNSIKEKLKQNQSVAIIGLPRIGTTSCAKSIMFELEQEGNKTIDANLQSLPPVNNENELKKNFERLISRNISELQKSVVLYLRETHSSVFLNTDYGKKFFKEIMENTSVLFEARPNSDLREFVADENKFYLSALSQDYAFELIEGLLKNNPEINLNPDTETIKWVYEMTGGRPFEIMTFLSNIKDEKKILSKQKIEKATLEGVAKKRFPENDELTELRKGCGYELTKHTYDEYWRFINENEQRALVAIATTEIEEWQISSQTLKFLEKIGLVENSQIKGKLFKEYLKNR